MENYIDILSSAFLEIWESFILFLPKLLFALLVLTLGLMIAGTFQRAIVKLFNVFKIDDLVERVQLDQVFHKFGVQFHAGRFFGWMIKWFTIIFALIAAADILEWSQVTVFLNEVVSYTPNVIIATIILLVGSILANFVHSIIESAINAAKMSSVRFLGGIAKWAIIVFSFMAALVQLGIAESLIQTLFTGFVAMLALAGGLAFGLGGRDHAKEVINKLKLDLSSKENKE